MGSLSKGLRQVAGIMAAVMILVVHAWIYLFLFVFFPIWWPIDRHWARKERGSSLSLLSRLIGAVMDDALLLRIAQAFELARPLLRPPLP